MHILCVFPLSCEQCSGCRRVPQGERNHCVEVLLADGSSLQLSASSEAESLEWLQCLCQAVAQGMQVRLYKSHGCACLLYRAFWLMTLSLKTGKIVCWIKTPLLSDTGDKIDYLFHAVLIWKLIYCVDHNKHPGALADVSKQGHLQYVILRVSVT